jgi:hypothetical protein
MEEPPDKQPTAAASQENATPDPGSVVRPPAAAIHESEPPNRQSNNANQRRKWTNDAPIFWVTLAGVIVVVAYTSVAAWQAYLTRGQLGIMQGQLDIMGADQRPWVSIKQLSISSGLAYDDVGWPNGKRWHIKLTYTLKNYGKTPATHVIFWAHILPIVSHYRNADGVLHGSFIGDDLNAACAFQEGMTEMATDSGQLMFPGDEWSPKTFEVEGDEKVFEEAKAAGGHYTGIFSIPVCVTYRSAYSDIRGLFLGEAETTILGNDHYRTAEGYRLGKQSRAAINLNGEQIGESDLGLGQPGFQATSIK